MFLLILLLLGESPLRSESENVTVRTKSGPVVGSVTTLDGNEINVFLGIPFAEPPVGQSRFKKPQPVGLWPKPVIANRFPPACIQYYPERYPWVDALPEQSEDCLYLNIWAPKPKPYQKEKKAVMFWIYGGAFSTGSNRIQDYNGLALAAYGDVILVTVNYRVGIFGFLSVGTDEAPGNMGMYDVLTALIWVNENIEEFGGDKNSITIFGWSAGSVIASYLTMCPRANGLFKRIILESAAPFSLKNASQRNDELAQSTAKAVGCFGKDLVDCFREKDAHYLAIAAYYVHPNSIITFRPTVDGECLRIDPVLARKTGAFRAVDIIGGFVQDSGSIFLASSFPELYGHYGEKVPKINRTLGRQLILKMLDHEPFKHTVADYYLSGVNENDYDTIRRQVYRSYGDYLINCPVVYFVERLSQEGVNSYMYYFYHLPSSWMFHPSMGVAPYAEVDYAFGVKLIEPNYNNGEVLLSKKMSMMWAQFAKTGAPSPEWKQYSGPNRYVQNFYVEGLDKDNRLDEHLRNCEFYRPYLD